MYCTSSIPLCSQKENQKKSSVDGDLSAFPLCRPEKFFRHRNDACPSKPLKGLENSFSTFQQVTFLGALFVQRPQRVLVIMANQLTLPQTYPSEIRPYEGLGYI